MNRNESEPYQNDVEMQSTYKREAYKRCCLYVSGFVNDILLLISLLANNLIVL